MYKRQCHTCRNLADLQYGKELVNSVKIDPLVGDLAKNNLYHYQTVTRDEFVVKGRITDLMTSGKIFSDLGMPRISAIEDRGMICGSMEMLRDTKKLLEEFGLEEGANNNPATFVVERAFVD